MTYAPFVYIILVNYQGWQHTIECLEGLFRGSYENFAVIVVDNGSSDHSLENIQLWAEGRLDLLRNNTDRIDIHSYPPVSKPIKYIQLGAEQISPLNLEKMKDHRLFIISSRTNLGFAGANNLAMRLALYNDKCKYLWLLNNDTVAEKDALRGLVKKAERANKTGLRYGLWGSKLLYYHHPERINAVGAKYYKWIGLSRQIGIMEIDRGQYDRYTSEIDYIVGASLFIDREFISQTGMMCEDYFLYYEELDWTLRGIQKGWAPALCPESLVYHKEGATIGSSKGRGTKSITTDYYAYRNRILFTLKFFPYCLFTVLIASIGGLLFRLLKGDIGNLKAIARGIIDGIRQVKGRVDYV